MSKHRNMKHTGSIIGLLVGTALGAPVLAHAETVVSVTQTSYDYQNHPVCSATRMNPAVYGSLPADACALSTAGSYGPDRITHNTYDAAGQLIQVDQAYGTSVQRAYAHYYYNPNGTKLYEVDADNNTTGYMYDGFDRLAFMAYPSPTTHGATSGTDYETFAYDNNGNRTAWRRRSNKTITYTYDNLNRELTRSVSDGSVQTVYSGYDALGHLVYARFGSASGTGITNYYDSLGRLSSSNDINGRSVWYNYNQASARTVLYYPDTNAIGYTLDNANRVKEIGLSAYSGLISFTYDSLGRRHKMLRGAVISGGENPDLPCVTQTNATCYSYDGIGRLAHLSNDLVNTSGDVTWDFTPYNPAGQIVSTTASSTLYDYKETLNSTDNRTYDGLNRDQTLVVATTACPVGGYDANGNLICDGTRLFTYDIYNRLIGVGTTAYPSNPPYLTLTYDPLGRLSSYSWYSTPVYFAYDGTNLIGEYDASGNMTERYVHGSGTDEPLAWFHNGFGTERFFVQDYHGSVIGYTDSSGTLLDLYRYGPYGEPKNAGGSTISFYGSDGSMGSRFRYTGQTVIPEASLYYYKARVYDPIMGRFLQTDPIGSRSDLDLYAYTGGDPVNGSDPLGLKNMTTGGQDSPNPNCDWTNENCTPVITVTRGDQPYCNAACFETEAALELRMRYDRLFPAKQNIGLIELGPVDKAKRNYNRTWWVAVGTSVACVGGVIVTGVLVVGEAPTAGMDSPATYAAGVATVGTCIAAGGAILQALDAGSDLSDETLRRRK